MRQLNAIQLLGYILQAGATQQAVARYFSISSPDRPSLLYVHGTTPLKGLMTGQGQVVTE